MAMTDDQLNYDADEKKKKAKGRSKQYSAGSLLNVFKESFGTPEATASTEQDSAEQIKQGAALAKTNRAQTQAAAKTISAEAETVLGKKITSADKSKIEKNFVNPEKIDKIADKEAQGKKQPLADSFTGALSAFLPEALGMLIGGVAEGSEGAVAGFDAAHGLKQSYLDQQNKEDNRKMQLGMQHGAIASKAIESEKDRELKRELMTQKLSGGEAVERLKAGASSFKDAKDLRSEYNGLSKEIGSDKVSVSYNKVLQSSQLGTGAGDLAMIFNYMKMLDPGSVIRESEFKSAAEARASLTDLENSGVTVPTKFLQLFNKYDAGTILTEQQKGEFIEAAESVLGAQLDHQKLLDDEYSGLSNRFGVAPDLVVANRYTDQREMLKQNAIARDIMKRKQNVAKNEGSMDVFTPEANAESPAKSRAKSLSDEQIQARIDQLLAGQGQ